MAQKGCKSCRKWQEHYYSEHMDVRKIRFFRLLTGDFEQRISIPDRFVSNFSRQITKGFDLKAPSGEAWHVGITKVANELFFMSGWQDFVKAHELQENDLLLFTCSGNSSFEVLIFDESGCEKLTSLFAGKTGPKMCKHFKKMMGKKVEQYCLSDSDDSRVPSQVVGFPHKASTSKKSNDKTKPRKEPESPNSSRYHVKHDTIKEEAIEEEATEEEESDDSNSDSNYYYSRAANQLIDEEKEEIVGLASIQPDNHAFVNVLRKYNVQRKNNFLYIPSAFAADHLKKTSHEILLLRPNRKEKWYVRFYHTSSTRGFYCYSWFKFVRDNRLREGYICVFELIKGAKRMTMIVHVIRKDAGRFVTMD